MIVLRLKLAIGIESDLQGIPGLWEKLTFEVPQLPCQLACIVFYRLSDALELLPSRYLDSKFANKNFGFRARLPLHEKRPRPSLSPHFFLNRCQQDLDQFLEKFVKLVLIGSRFLRSRFACHEFAHLLLHGV